MMKKLFSILFIGLSIFGSQFLFAEKEYPEDSNFSKFFQAAIEYKKTCKPERVLLIFDIDNTILTNQSGSELGSEQWFDWQEKLIRERDKNQCMANKFDDLLVLQGIFYYFFSDKRTNEDLPGMLKQFAADGYKTLILTSRGPEYRYSTERDLKDQNLDFSSSTINSCIMLSKPILPYDIFEIEKSGYLKLSDLCRFRLDVAAPISYGNGILMTGGQHKGVILQYLLHKTGLSQYFSAIIYIDNKSKQIERMEQAFEGSGIKFTGFRYSGQDEKELKVIKIQSDDDIKKRQDKMWNEWNEIKQFIAKYQ